MNSGPKWSLRNGAQYRRLCARPGCGAAAVATLRFQSTERQAWLVELDVNASRTQGDLCQRHAAALVLPRGWELHDERVPGNWPPVASVDTATETAAKNGKRRVRARRKAAPAAPEAAVTQLPGFEPASTAAAELHEPAPEMEEPVAEEVVPSDAAPSNGTAARPVPAQFGPRDEEDVEEELGEILDARTPLLQRAFRNAKPQTDEDE
jgi:hypothetical protein